MLSESAGAMFTHNDAFKFVGLSRGKDSLQRPLSVVRETNEFEEVDLWKNYGDVTTFFRTSCRKKEICFFSVTRICITVYAGSDGGGKIQRQPVAMRLHPDVAGADRNCRQTVKQVPPSCHPRKSARERSRLRQRLLPGDGRRPDGPGR